MPQMTFLQLVQRLRSECGIAGTGPTTVSGQSGELGRLVNYTSNAWIELMDEHEDLRFKRNALAGFATVAGKTNYLPETDCGITAGTFGRWAKYTFRNYVTAQGVNSEIPMSYLPYDAWRNTYLINAMRNVKTRPNEISIAPDDSLCLGPIADVGYTIVGDYYRASVLLAIDGDIPGMPSKYNPLIIVWRALMDYGLFEGAPELYTKGEKFYYKLLRTMLKDQLPRITMSAPIA